MDISHHTRWIYHTTSHHCHTSFLSIFKINCILFGYEILITKNKILGKRWIKTDQKKLLWLFQFTSDVKTPHYKSILECYISADLIILPCIIYKIKKSKQLFCLNIWVLLNPHKYNHSNIKEIKYHCPWHIWKNIFFLFWIKI